MKKNLLLAAILFGVLHVASAVTVYTQNWGSPNNGVGGNGNIFTVGWTGVAVSQVGGTNNTGPYLGIYQAAGASDPALGLGLPVNTVYFTVLLPNQTNAAMFYTTDTSGSGSGGNSSFVDINPTLYTNLTFNLEVRGAATDTNYFAVRIGASWFVCTSFQMPASSVPYPQFTNAALVYTNAGNVWQNLTFNGTNNVIIGSVAAPSLTSPITGIGVVELPTAGGFNYNELVINQGPQDFPSSPPTNTVPAIPQTVYAGGGFSFLSLFSGTPNLVYQWKTNGLNMSNGGRFSGVNGNLLTVTNANANDASAIYSIVVTNFFGRATNDGITLTVNSVPPDFLYAETFPYVGPNGNLPITGVGWLSAASAGTVVGIYSAGGGLGDVFSYSPTATTNIYYTTSTNDTGASGLPFVAFNPSTNSFTTLQAGFVPGNGAGQVPGAMSVYWAVDMNGTWYASVQAVPIDLSALSPYQVYQLGFNPNKTNWNTVTIGATGATIGAQASSDLTGNITGAGLVVAHNNGTGSDMNFQNFEITTTQAVGTPPTITVPPYAVAVSAGGGAGFGVSASGSPPFTYGWTTNGVLVSDGGRASGAHTATLTIANLNPNDNNMQIVAFVTNSAGSDRSDTTFGATTLNVTNPPIGLIYTENTPFVGTAAGNYPVSSIGWVEAVPSAPNALYQRTPLTSDGAIFAYLGGVGTTVYYATTASDTNQSGLPFPNVNLAGYPGLNISVDIAPVFSSSNVTAYLAVELNGANWYVAASPLPVPTTVDSAGFSTYTTAFSATAANWNNLTVTGSGGLVGSSAAADLKGVMTGAGLVFVTVGSGGTFNFSNFVITGTGLGDINISRVGSNANLTWVGNPAVNLQSTPSLNPQSWADVPNTLGLYSMTVSVSGSQQYFRLVKH